MPATTPNLALPYPVPADTVDVPRDVQALAVKLDSYSSAISPPLVAILPVAPVDGQECYFQSAAMATDGLIWHLRARTLKWEFLGGQGLYAEIQPAGGYEATSSDIYVGLATPGPVITLPVAGDWMIEFGARVAVAVAGTGARMSYEIGATLAADADSFRVRGDDTGGNMEGEYMRRKRKLGLTAVTLTTKYRRDVAAGAVTFASRWIRATPIRLG